MENTLGSLKCDLDFTDVLLGCTYDPLIKSSLFLVYELLCEVLLYSFELFIFLCDIVTEHVYGNFEIHQTQLSIHFPIIYNQRRKIREEKLNKVPTTILLYLTYKRVNSIFANSEEI